jgi:hypothetical protein
VGAEAAGCRFYSEGFAETRVQTCRMPPPGFPAATEPPCNLISFRCFRLTALTVDRRVFQNWMPQFFDLVKFSLQPDKLGFVMCKIVFEVPQAWSIQSKRSASKTARTILIGHSFFTSQQQRIAGELLPWRSECPRPFSMPARLLVGTASWLDTDYNPPRRIDAARSISSLVL